MIPESCSGCTCLTFLQYVFSIGFPKHFTNDNQGGPGETAGELLTAMTGSVVKLEVDTALQSIKIGEVGG